MYNDPTLDGKYLGILSADFVKIADKLKEVSYFIRKKGGYEYPVFVVSKVEISIGTLLIAQGRVKTQMNFVVC